MTDADITTEIAAVLNRASMENGSDTPDSILAEYLWACLRAFDTATKARDAWWGLKPWAKATGDATLSSTPPAAVIPALPIDAAAESRIEKLLAEKRAAEPAGVCARCAGRRFDPEFVGACGECGGSGRAT